WGAPRAPTPRRAPALRFSIRPKVMFTAEAARAKLPQRGTTQKPDRLIRTKPAMSATMSTPDPTATVKRTRGKAGKRRPATAGRTRAQVTIRILTGTTKPGILVTAATATFRTVDITSPRAGDLAAGSAGGFER